MTIKFGTDGWRAVISEDFTFANVRRVAQAVAEQIMVDWVERAPMEHKSNGQPSMVVGYDTRFLSDRYAVAVAEVLAANGVRVWLSQSDAPTPLDQLRNCGQKG